LGARRGGVFPPNYRLKILAGALQHGPEKVDFVVVRKKSRGVWTARHGKKNREHKGHEATNTTFKFRPKRRPERGERQRRGTPMGKYGPPVRPFPT